MSEGYLSKDTVILGLATLIVLLSGWLFGTMLHTGQELRTKVAGLSELVAALEALQDEEQPEDISQ